MQAFGFGLKNVDLKVVSADTWQGTATLVLPTPNQFGFTIGIGLKNGGLDYLAGGVTGLNISIADGVFLQSITLSGGGSGIPWTGNVGLTAGPQVAGHAAITINGVGELHARQHLGARGHRQRQARRPLRPRQRRRQVHLQRHVHGQGQRRLERRDWRS